MFKKSIYGLILIGLFFWLGYEGNRSLSPREDAPTAQRLNLKPSVSVLPRSSRGVVAAVEEPARERRVLPPPQVREVRYHPRAEGEWQGMPVDIAVTPPCDTTDQCQLALACTKQVCTVCTEDRDCSGGEICVLDHCLVKENAGCVAARDCPDQELCMLESTGSDAFADPRGNKFLFSECTESGRGRNKMQPREEAVLSEPAPDPPSGPGSFQTSGAKDLQLQFARSELQ